jgi:hypothetical protein
MVLDGEESYHIVVWFKLVKKFGCIDFIKDFKSKAFVVTKKGISTLSTPYPK